MSLFILPTEIMRLILGKKQGWHRGALEEGKEQALGARSTSREQSGVCLGKVNEHALSTMLAGGLLPVPA